MYAFAVDFGGTLIKLGLMKKGIIMDFATLPSHAGRDFDQLLRQIVTAYERMLDARQLKRTDLLGMGVAIPGIVDFDRKKVLSVNKKYEAAVGFSFEQWAQDSFKLSLVIDNDAKAALIGEVTFGSAKGETDAVLMTFGTGIGTAAIINGRLLRGKHHQAGCLGGHITTGPAHFVCTCGNMGCLEATAGNWALPIVAKDRDGFSSSLLAKQEIVDYHSVIYCAEQGDDFSRLFLDYLLNQWSAGIVNLIHAYDPQTVILSGGLMKSSLHIRSEIERRVRKRAWTPWGDIRFAIAENPDQSVLYGLEVLIMEQYSRRERV